MTLPPNIAMAMPAAETGMVRGGSPAATPLWVVFGLSMGPVVGLGLARFAYALLLPTMRADLDWSFADAGAMNTANAAGYLVGALAAAPIGRRCGDRITFAAGLLLTALTVGASGLTASFTCLLVLRALAGFTGALAFVTGAGLTSLLAAGCSASYTSTLLGVYFAGAGIGITASAVAVPPILAPFGWRAGWSMLGAVALIATLYGWLALRWTPQHVYDPKQTRATGSIRFMIPLLLSYCLFGAGYIAYATFIIAFLRAEGFTSAAITAFWTILGLAAVVAAFAWGPILGRLRGGWGTVATLSLMTVGTALPLISAGPPGAYLSSLLFGGSFLAVLAAVTSFARRCLQSHAWTGAIGTFTVAFGIGQCIGPLLSGILSDGPDGIRAGLWLSVGILIASVAVATLQRESLPN